MRMDFGRMQGRTGGETGMLLKTYDRIIQLFHENRGYMSFDMMKEEGITVVQIQELVDKGGLERFARGCYWCNECGLTKPEHYRYIETALANDRSVICMDSALYLLGMIRSEPEVISVATERTDRRKMDLPYPVNRLYLQHTGMEGEIEIIEVDGWQVRVYSMERTMCDCLRMQARLEPGVLEEAEAVFRKRKGSVQRVTQYAKRLRALKCVMERDGWQSG